VRAAIVTILLWIGALSQPMSIQAQDIVGKLLPEGSPGRLVLPKPAERPRVIRQLRALQAATPGDRPQQVAFLLAALGADYDHNRDFLFWALKGCEDPNVTHGCDELTGQYLIYLYEHGHPEILAPLLASSIKSYCAACSEGLGAFFSELVAKSPNEFLDAVRQFPVPTQKKMCSFAGYGDGSGMAEADLRKVRKQLGAMNDEVARRCLRQIEAANKPH